MFQSPCDVQVNENLHRYGNRIYEAEYIYYEIYENGEQRKYHMVVNRAHYERLAATMQRPTLSFDSFVKVLRPFMMGHFAAEDIPEAFYLLDFDHSGTIDIGELAALMHATVPDGNPYMLLHHIQKVNKNYDYKLNLAEFTTLINRGIGRKIVLGHL